MLQHDFRSRDGCVFYVEHEVLPTLVKSFAKLQDVHPHGVVFASHHNGKPLPNIEARTVAQMGVSGRGLKKALQKIAEQNVALGVLYIRRDDFTNRAGHTASTVVVQLEHKAFEDLVWTAGISGGKTLEPFVGPLALRDTDLTDLKRTAFLAHRWMA